MSSPVPDNLKLGGHHWLDKFDCDGHYIGRVILQWEPAAKHWVYSGSSIWIDTTNWKYVGHQPMPEN